ncbi:chorismate dehydratase [Malonomonas rubra DSM 5091]|uniref:Chorismate dehydratase n=1 Tax=Malonomonas rubra DSM 5091 TaxID=1122189 RepID=A0A1M6LIT7_MALRU|nr:menaquinone biosynthesis protein [Malonomonas rubra]SHJ71082.1 chorismate dehydratase [Malonomonas rubra DSM 5091]
MSPTEVMTLGVIHYLNCVPFFHFLRENGFKGELVPGVPSALNTLLQQGKLDASPSSSFEYALHWRDYLLLPDHSISSAGKILSVLLFSPVDPSELTETEIAITGESATSINLLRVILREFYQLESVCDAVPDVPVEELIAQQRPALLIGDRALKMAANCPAGMQVYDLGELWHQHTGLPFVFALWMIRRDSLKGHAAEIEALSGQLHNSCRQLMAAPDAVAEKYTEACGLQKQQIVDYWHCIDYRLSEQYRAGLLLFFKLCVKYQLLPEMPELEFIEAR